VLANFGDTAKIKAPAERSSIRAQSRQAEVPWCVNRGRTRSLYPAPARDDGLDSVECAANPADCVFNLAGLHQAYPIKGQRARGEHRHRKASKTTKSCSLTHERTPS
jgi:hypothetical protein